MTVWQVNQIYSLALQLNKANTSDTKVAFLTKFYDTRDDFDFEMGQFPIFWW